MQAQLTYITLPARCQVPVKCIQGQLYVRISAHIYNVRADFERLAEAVLELVHQQQQQQQS